MQYYAREKMRAHGGTMWSDQESPSDNIKRERDERRLRLGGGASARREAGGDFPGLITGIITHTWASPAWEDSN